MGTSRPKKTAAAEHFDGRLDELIMSMQRQRPGIKRVDAVRLLVRACERHEASLKPRYRQTLRRLRDELRFLENLGDGGRVVPKLPWEKGPRHETLRDVWLVLESGELALTLCRDPDHRMAWVMRAQTREGPVIVVLPCELTDEAKAEAERLVSARGGLRGVRPR